MKLDLWNRLQSKGWSSIIDSTVNGYTLFFLSLSIVYYGTVLLSNSLVDWKAPNRKGTCCCNYVQQSGLESVWRTIVGSHTTLDGSQLNNRSNPYWILIQFSGGRLSRSIVFRVNCIQKLAMSHFNIISVIAMHDSSPSRPWCPLLIAIYTVSNPYKRLIDHCNHLYSRGPISPRTVIPLIHYTSIISVYGRKSHWSSRGCGRAD